MNRSLRTSSLASVRHEDSAVLTVSVDAVKGVPLIIGGEDFEEGFDCLSTCVCLLCLQMRSVVSWLAFLLDVSVDLGNPCISLADNS